MDNVQGREYRVFVISTVRTHHLAGMELRIGSANCDGGDYGFLSDKKLLNTAFTRTQSMVCVVGDPVALCSIGECLNIWRHYISACGKKSGLHPPGVTIDTIKMQVS